MKIYILVFLIALTNIAYSQQVFQNRAAKTVQFVISPKVYALGQTPDYDVFHVVNLKCLPDEVHGDYVCEFTDASLRRPPYLNNGSPIEHAYGELADDLVNALRALFPKRIVGKGIAVPSLYCKSINYGQDPQRVYPTCSEGPLE